MKNKKCRCNVMLDYPLKNDAEVIAREKGMSFSQIIRDALKLWLDNNEFILLPESSNGNYKAGLRRKWLEKDSKNSKILKENVAKSMKKSAIALGILYDKNIKIEINTNRGENVKIHITEFNC